MSGGSTGKKSKIHLNKGLSIFKAKEVFDEENNLLNHHICFDFWLC